MMLHMFLGIIVVLNVSLQPNDRLDKIQDTRYKFYLKSEYKNIQHKL